MSINNFIKENLNVNSISDAEGVYIYYVNTKGENESLLPYKENDSIKSSIVLECDEDNYLSVKYFDESENPIFVLDGSKISAMKFLDDEYEDMNGDILKEKALIFYSDTWNKRYLRIDLYPSASVALEIDYDKYETDENGVVIWD